MTTAAKFIGINALQELATKLSPNIVVGAAHFRPDVFTRMKIKVSTGLQYKDVVTVMLRKGHTTVRKVVGEKVSSQGGYLIERKMVGRLDMLKFDDNKDNYVELAVVDANDNTRFNYPLSELAFMVAVANYGEDLFDCLWHGDDTIAKDAENAYLRLYTGFIPYLNNDIKERLISEEMGNLVHINAIEAPDSTSDISAYTEFKKFRSKWSPNLQNAPEVMIYCTEETGSAIADAYGNSKGNNRDVIYMEDGNFKIPEYRNIIFAPEASFGVGDKMIATIPYNFEYGVDTLNSRTFVSVREGSDNDHMDISYQVQSIQGTRVIRIDSSSFCMTDGALLPNNVAGDYTKNLFVVNTNDTKLGTVTVNGKAPENDTDYPANTTLNLVATATSTGEFVGWSNGETGASITVVTKGQPGGIMAIFKAKTTEG